MLKLLGLTAMMAISVQSFANETTLDLQTNSDPVDYWQYEGLDRPMLDEELTQKIPPIADVIDLVAHGRAR